MQAFDLGLGKGDTLQVLGFSRSETALSASALDGLTKKLMGLFPGALTLRDAKQAGRIAPLLGDPNTIFADQWQELTSNDVDALVLFSITSVNADSASITISISNRGADQRSIADIVMPIDRTAAALDLSALARTQTSDIVSRLKGSGGLAVLPATSEQAISQTCAETLRQTYLAAFAQALASKIDGQLTLRRSDADTLKPDEVGVALAIAITAKPTSDVPSFTVTTAIEALGFYSQPALVVAPSTCVEDIDAIQLASNERVPPPANGPDSGQACSINIRSMQRVFKVGDELTFQIQPSCDCWPVLIDYTDAQGTEVFRPEDLVHRLAFERAFIPAGTTVNVPYSNEPYDPVTDTVYDFKLTIEPPKRTNTLGVVCAASRKDALSFTPTGLSKVSRSRGFGAALKKKITKENVTANRYVSATRVYYVE
jgi:hypothetical protein